MPESVLCFPLKSFITSNPIFRSLIHFIFVYNVRKCSSFILLHVAHCCFLSITYWTDCLFSTVQSCLLCHWLVDHTSVGLSLDFLSCSNWSIFLFLCQYHTILITVVEVQSKVREPESSSSVFFLSQDCFGYHKTALCLHTNCKLFLS